MTIIHIIKKDYLLYIASKNLMYINTKRMKLQVLFLEVVFLNCYNTFEITKFYANSFDSSGQMFTRILKKKRD